MRKWLKGYVICLVRSGSWERFMNMCRYHTIEIWKIRKEENQIFFCVSVNDYKKLTALSKKAKLTPHILKRKGLPFGIEEICRNWSFYSGFLLFLILLNVLSSFIWEITYTGQRSYSQSTLEQTVENMSIYPGMKRSRLHCDAIEKSLRQKYPDISWVSAEEVGSVLKISIKEGKKNVVHSKETKPSHLTAMYDGVVQSIQVNKGTALVKKGQTVKKGQILISGIVPVTDDNKEIVSKRATTAKGSVSLLVNERVERAISIQHKEKVYTGKKKVIWNFQLGNQRFSIKNPFKRFNNSYKYDIINEICVNKKVHPFSYSIEIGKQTYWEYQWKTLQYSKKELKQQGMKLFQNILDSYTDDNMELLSHAAVLHRKDAKNWILQGKITFFCEKMNQKAVTQNEIQLEKADGGTHGES